MPHTEYKSSVKLLSRLVTLITPTISNTEAAMQQIIITYMKNLSSADQQTTANINRQRNTFKGKLCILRNNFQ